MQREGELNENMEGKKLSKFNKCEEEKMGPEGLNPAEEAEFQKEVDQSIENLGPEAKELDNEIKAKKEELKKKLDELSDYIDHPSHHSSGPEWELAAQEMSTIFHLNNEANALVKEVDQLSKKYIELVSEKIE